MESLNGKTLEELNDIKARATANLGIKQLELSAIPFQKTIDESNKKKEIATVQANIVSIDAAIAAL